MKSFLQTIILISLAACLTVVGAHAEEDVHFSTADAMKAATAKVQPDYPAMARQLHLEGSVAVEARIGEDGSVDSVKALTGNAVLMNAALAAMKHWKFTPFTAGGKPVKAVVPMTFNFKL